MFTSLRQKQGKFTVSRENESWSLDRVETKKIRFEVSLRQKTNQVSLSLVPMATRFRY